MASYPRIKTPNEITETVFPQSQCGMNWFYDVTVRSAYKGMDTMSWSLPGLAEKKQMEDRDPDLTDQLKAERTRVVNLRNHSKNLLTSTQKSNIDKYLGRAKKYIEDAAALEDGWRIGFIWWTTGEKVIPFALHIDFGDIRNGFCVGKYGHKSTNVYEPNCPTMNQMIGHDRDVDKWQKLMMGAVINIRCSEEVIRKAEVKAENKKRYLNNLSVVQIKLPPKTVTLIPGALKPQPSAVGGVTLGGSSSGGTFQPQPMPVAPPLLGPEEEEEEEEYGLDDDSERVSMVEGDLSEEEEGPGVLEEQETVETTVEPEPEPKKKKKKSNVPLIAAAGIGALLLMR